MARAQHSRQQYKLKGEDRSVVCDIILDDGDVVQLFGVFDGHGGPLAAEYAAATLPALIAERYARATERTRSARLRSACKAAFIQCDAQFTRANERGDGTTASIAILDGRELTAANVGDSSAVLYTPGGGAISIVTDHRVERCTAAEHKRVLEGGARLGRIKGPSGKAVGPMRLYPGGLMVTRSIGDSDSTPACIAEPAVLSLALPPAGGTIVLATDGVWDFIEEAHAARLVAASHAPKCGVGWLSRALLRTANQHNVMIDDATVLCVCVPPLAAELGGDEGGLSLSAKLKRSASAFFAKRRARASVGPEARARAGSETSDVSRDPTYDARLGRESDEALHVDEELIVVPS